mgnify:CR=1 FL=1
MMCFLSFSELSDQDGSNFVDHIETFFPSHSKIKNKTIIEIMMLRLKKFKYYKNIIIAIPDTKKITS